MVSPPAQAVLLQLLRLQTTTSTCYTLVETEYSSPRTCCRVSHAQLCFSTAITPQYAQPGLKPCHTTMQAAGSLPRRYYSKFKHASRVFEGSFESTHTCYDSHNTADSAICFNATNTARAHILLLRVTTRQSLSPSTRYITTNSASITELKRAPPPNKSPPWMNAYCPPSTAYTRRSTVSSPSRRQSIDNITAPSNL